MWSTKIGRCLYVQNYWMSLLRGHRAIHLLWVKLGNDIIREDKTKLNPLSPHDALKHHFTSLKTVLIFPQLRVLERKFPWNWFTNTWQFSLIFKPYQIIFIHYKSRIAAAMVNSGMKGLRFLVELACLFVWFDDLGSVPLSRCAANKRICKPLYTWKKNIGGTSEAGTRLRHD